MRILNICLNSVLYTRTKTLRNKTNKFSFFNVKYFRILICYDVSINLNVGKAVNLKYCTFFIFLKAYIYAACSTLNVLKSLFFAMYKVSCVAVLILVQIRQ